MNLDNLREYLDNFDKAICSLLLHRMSLIPLVAETKIESCDSIFQKERENFMFEKIDKFCDSSEFETRMLKDIYRRIIDEAYKIEGDVIDNKKIVSTNDEVDGVERIEKFIEKVSLLNDDKNNFNFEELTKSYKKILNNL